MSDASRKWLTVTMARPPPLVALCLTPIEYQRINVELKVIDQSPWLVGDSDATTHFLVGPKGRVSIVCLNGAIKLSKASALPLLVHEAVHIWQAYAEHIKEDKPGAEQEAYAVQGISHALFTEYLRKKWPNRRTEK